MDYHAVLTKMLNDGMICNCARSWVDSLSSNSGNDLEQKIVQYLIQYIESDDPEEYACDHYETKPIVWLNHLRRYKFKFTTRIWKAFRARVLIHHGNTEKVSQLIKELAPVDYDFIKLIFGSSYDDYVPDYDIRLARLAKLTVLKPFDTADLINCLPYNVYVPIWNNLKPELKVGYVRPANELANTCTLFKQWFFARSSEQLVDYQVFKRVCVSDTLYIFNWLELVSHLPARPLSLVCSFGYV